MCVFCEHFEPSIAPLHSLNNCAIVKAFNYNCSSKDYQTIYQMAFINYLPQGKFFSNSNIKLYASFFSINFCPICGRILNFNYIKKEDSCFCETFKSKQIISQCGNKRQKLTFILNDSDKMACIECICKYPDKARIPSNSLIYNGLDKQIYQFHMTYCPFCGRRFFY